MKCRLEAVENLLVRLRDDATDDEVSDELDNALIHLDVAKDRLIAIEEEEEEEEDDHSNDDRLYDQWRDAQDV